MVDLYYNDVYSLNVSIEEIITAARQSECLPDRISEYQAPNDCAVAEDRLIAILYGIYENHGSKIEPSETEKYSKIVPWLYKEVSAYFP